MERIKTSLIELNQKVLQGRINEGDYLEIEESDNPELTIYANHGNKILTVRRGNYLPRNNGKNQIEINFFIKKNKILILYLFFKNFY